MNETRAVPLHTEQVLLLEEIGYDLLRKGDRRGPRLLSIALCWKVSPVLPQIRGGTDGVSQAGSDATAVVSPSPLGATAAASGGERPSAPVTPIPLATRRAPCS